jgi:hypothetical protein
VAKNSIGFSIERLVFSGGQGVGFGPDDLVVVVGPNNSGKSATLREITTRLNRNPGQGMPVGQVVTAHTIRKTANIDETWQTIRALGRLQRGAPDTYFFRNEGINENGVTAFMHNPDAIGPLMNWLAVHIDAGSRLGLSQTQQSIDFGNQHPTHPLHFLHQDFDMMAKLGRWFKRAFGTEIAINHLAGSTIPLHVGHDIALSERADVLSADYRERLLASPRLDAQGDGMRSFVGLLMHVLLGHQSLSLVDEPEAFLHPPQAQLLGRLLAENHGGGQVFVATHSADFLKGLLEARDRSVRILRLTRRGDQNDVAELRPDDVREVWSDPVLRYSNVLDGVFHEMVVICEAEGDCRFYGALADALRDEDEHPFARDVMFVQSGGKGGIPKLVNALKALKVPVAAVVDFDALCTTGQFRTLVECFGGDWAALQADYRVVKASIDELGRVTAPTLKARLETLAAGIDETVDDITQRTISDLRGLQKLSVGNSRAKESGMGMLGREAKVCAERMLNALADVGVFVVPTGELESFVPSESAEKNAWVASVLERYGANLKDAPELAAARDFVSRLIRA